MARWRLRTAHYLNIPVYPDGTKVEWEHTETDRNTGRVNRKYFPVPMLLDTNNPGDYNDGNDIIVAHEGKGQRKDYIFFGEPTPDMEPIDDEAEEISASLQHKWTHPIETLAPNGGMSDKEKAFMDMMMKAVGGQATPVANDDVAKLKEMIEKQQAQINAMLNVKPAETEPARRV